MLARSKLTDLAARIKAEHEAVSEALAESVCHAVAAGKLLITAKALVPHGQWLPWLRDHTHIAERTAQVYMQLARLTPEKRNAVADLPLREAMDAIAHKRKLENPERPSQAIAAPRPSAPVECLPPRPPQPPATPEGIADELMSQLANALHEARDDGLTVEILASSDGLSTHTPPRRPPRRAFCVPFAVFLECTRTPAPTPPKRRSERILCGCGDVRAIELDRSFKSGLTRRAAKAFADQCCNAAVLSWVNKGVAGNRSFA